MTKAEKTILVTKCNKLWAELKEYQYLLALNSKAETYHEFTESLGSHHDYQCRLWEWCAVSDILAELKVDPMADWSMEDEYHRRAHEAMDATWAHFHE